MRRKHAIGMAALLLAGVIVGAAGCGGYNILRVALMQHTPGVRIAAAYFSALAADRLKTAEGDAVGQALAALEFNTTGQPISHVPVVSLRILPEEVGQGAVLEGVAAETGGAHPTVAQYQVLTLSTARGWRVADVWEGSPPAWFGETAAGSAMLSTARAWLSDEVAGRVPASLDELAGGALTSAEQTSRSGKTWGQTVTISEPHWRVLAVSGDWGAVEGHWEASTPSGKTAVDLVLLGQMVGGQWRITRVVTIR